MYNEQCALKYSSIQQAVYAIEYSTVKSTVCTGVQQCTMSSIHWSTAVYSEQYVLEYSSVQQAVCTGIQQYTASSEHWNELLKQMEISVDFHSAETLST